MIIAGAPQFVVARALVPLSFRPGVQGHCLDSVIGAALIALPVLPLWAFSSTPVLLAVGAFLMQISVQGAWGVIPVHLNEISPDEIRATFPGLVYQLGNLIASVNGPLQASAAEAHGNNYALVMAVVIGIVALVICALIPFSRERRGIDMTQSAAHVGEPVQGRPAGQQL